MASVTSNPTTLVSSTTPITSTSAPTSASSNTSSLSSSTTTTSSSVASQDMSAWAQLTASSPAIPLLPVPCLRDNVVASSVSSPSAADSDCAAEVDDLLEGIDRIRIDDLWTTPRASRVLTTTSSCNPNSSSSSNNRGKSTSTTTTDYASLFAPPQPSSNSPYVPLPTPPQLSPIHSDDNHSPTLTSQIPQTRLAAAITHGSSNLHFSQQVQQKSVGQQQEEPRSASSAASSAASLVDQKQTHCATSVSNSSLSPQQQQPLQTQHCQTQTLHNHHPLVTSSQQPPRYEHHAQHDHQHNSHASHLHHHSHSRHQVSQQYHNDITNEFPRMFKVLPCPHRAACEASGDTSECFYYHDPNVDRRRVNVNSYKPHMCRFVDETAGCRKAERCPFAHNDFERRYHPDRFGKETCRDFLRGDCPRKYCTFRHHVSRKVEVALDQMNGMADKEMLQFVLKISEERGRALCDKLLRRFGHGKKHSGWKLEGFVPHGGRDDLKVKHITARVEAVKKRLKQAGEKKWAASLKTCSLRDMMSGVRKVAEEMRERCRADEQFVENGCEVHRLIRSVFSNTNWSCHSQEGDNPFLVTPENQNDAVSSLERLVDSLIEDGRIASAGNDTTVGSTARSSNSNKNNSTSGVDSASATCNNGLSNTGNGANVTGASSGSSPWASMVIGQTRV